MSVSRATRLLALVLALTLGAAMTGLLVWVGDGDDTPAPPTTRPTVIAPEGSLRVGVPEIPESLDPFDARSRTPSGTGILAAVLPQLFDVAPNGSVNGRLVDESTIEESAGGREVAFSLVAGARWSDSTPITADDVRFTLDVVRSEAWPGPDAGYELLEEVGGEGGEVRLRFSEPYPAWRRLFSGPDHVLPKHRLDGQDLGSVWDAGPDVAGGPYRLEGTTPYLEVVVAANPQWWGDGPFVEAIRVIVVPDPTTAEQLFLAGELDVLWVPAFTNRMRDVAEYEGAVVSVGEPGGHLVSLYVNTEEVPSEVRAAVLGLVDRDRFVGVLLGDEAEVATGWWPEGNGWESWSADPTRAGDLGAEVSLVSAVTEVMAALLARAVHEQAEGTDLTIENLEVDHELLDGAWLAGGQFDLAVVDEVQWPEPCWACRFADAWVGVTSWSRVEGLDDLADEADRLRPGAAGRLEGELRELGAVLPLWRPEAVVVSQGDFGITANAWYPGPLFRPETWRAAA